MIYRIGNTFEIRPYSNKLCWELWELRTVHSGKPDEAVKWVFTQKYPSSMQGALQSILELQLKRGTETIYGLKAAVDHVNKTAESFAIRSYDEECQCVDAGEDGLGCCSVCGGYMELGDNFCPACGRPQTKSNDAKVVD